MIMELRTDRLDLRPVTPLDLTALMVHWTDPEVRRFLFDGAELPAAEIAEAIADSEKSFASSGWGLWLVLAAGSLIGTCGLRELDDPNPELEGPEIRGPEMEIRGPEIRGPEIMYSLVPSAWGKGYATEAARAVIRYALDTLGLPEVLAEVDEGNAASRAIIEKLDMTEFATVPGQLGPMIRYRITRLLDTQ
jgi:[ribosomal protein S5]-alanine N-acetyltransferase